MIITVTLNPSLDYLYTIEDFKLGEHNRVQNPTVMVGGKGINSARACSKLGSEVFSIVILGGSIGQVVKEKLNEESLPYIALDAGQQQTRNALTIMHNGGKHTEIVEKGVYISKVIEDKVYNYIEKLLENSLDESNIISFAGSVNAEDENIYINMIQKLQKHTDVKIVADVSGEHLKKVFNLPTKVDCIKPNIHEFGELVNKKFTTKEDALKYIREGQFKYDGNILISCGSAGAIFYKKGRLFNLTIPKVNIVNTTGSGDATVGGLMHCLNEELTIHDTLKIAMGCGISNALNTGVGDIRTDEVFFYSDLVKIVEE